MTTTIGTEPALDALSRAHGTAPDPVHDARLLRRVARDVHAVAEEWVRLACEIKGIDPQAPIAAEEWFGGPVALLHGLRRLSDDLTRIAGSGRPPYRASDVVRRGGAVAVPVFPRGWVEGWTLPGTTAEVWQQHGVDEAQLESTAARRYLRDAAQAEGVCAVLGAGNVTSIGPLDALTKVFHEGRPVALALHPNFASLRPVLERGLAAWIESGSLALVEGGAEACAALLGDDRVTSAHLTGSLETHDRIVWGEPGAPREEPRFVKPLTSELGNVTPILIVPGVWSETELAFQARHVASMIANNASYNCVAAKVLVTSREWPQRRRFLEELSAVLAATPLRASYYPDTPERHERFCASVESEVVRVGAGDGLPWALATGLAPDRSDRTPFEEESWCPFAAEVALDARGAPEFLAAAVRFANDELFGNLACGILIDPDTERDPVVQRFFTTALRDLRYGTIAVNHWPAVGFALAALPWGAYPGNTLRDARSGLGTVHGTPQFAAPRKSVVRGGFRPKVPLPHVLGHKRPLETARALAALEAAPNPARLGALAWHALRG